MHNIDELQVGRVILPTFIFAILARDLAGGLFHPDEFHDGTVDHCEGAEDAWGLSSI